MIQKTASLEEMGLAWVENNYYKNLIETYTDFFTDWDKAYGVDEIKIKKFLGQEFLSFEADGDELEITIENIEKFENYWKIKEQRFPQEYDGYIKVKYDRNEYGFSISFNKRKCKNQVEDGYEKAVGLIGKKIEGYKLIRLFNPKVHWGIYQQMIHAVNKKDAILTEKSFSDEMEKIVFTDVAKRVERNNKKE